MIWLHSTVYHYPNLHDVYPANTADPLCLYLCLYIIYTPETPTQATHQLTMASRCGAAVDGPVQHLTRPDCCRLVLRGGRGSYSRFTLNICVYPYL